MTINLWARFKRLLPDTPLQIGTVRSIDLQAGTSTVEMLGRGVLTVRGTSVAIDARAYVRNGLIEGQAPDLPVVEIEV